MKTISPEVVDILISRYGPSFSREWVIDPAEIATLMGTTKESLLDSGLLVYNKAGEQCYPTQTFKGMLRATAN